MKHKIDQQMRRDCLRYMKYTGIAYFFSQFFMIALPSVNALLIGNMADALLSLDTQAIVRLLPGFSAAMLLTVFLSPLFTMVEYTEMNQYGFAYDAFLINRFIHKPLKDIKRADTGELLERLEGDLGDFCWYIVYIYFLPALLIAYAGLMAFLLLREGIPIPFLLCLLLLPSLSVIKAQISGKKKAALAREMSEYQEQRRGVEASVVPTANFVKSYRLSQLFQHFCDQLYAAYMACSGKKKIAFDSLQEALDFIFDQGIPLCIFAVGSFFVYQRRLTIGILISSPFLLSALQQFFAYGVKWVEALRAAPQLTERIALFYGELEPDEEAQVHAPFQTIQGKWLSFRYDPQRKPAIDHVSFFVQRGECLRIIGPNGCGKSTLLALISGLYPPDAGKLLDENGQRLDVIRLRRDVAIQEQDGAIFSGSILDNLFIPPADARKAENLLCEFGLEKPLSYEIEPEGINLSPGERKKILLIRALLKDAAFSVWDEPFNHLDEQGRQALIRHLLNRNRQQGIILITHQDFFPSSRTLRL